MIDVNDKIRAKVERLPGSPGVYRWKDKNGRVIYVGKAVNLRNRVRSYEGQVRSGTRRWQR